MLMIPWAMDFGDHVARHPSSLYQAFTEGLLLFLILWWYSRKPRPLMADVRQDRPCLLTGNVRRGVVFIVLGLW